MYAGPPLDLLERDLSDSQVSSPHLHYSLLLSLTVVTLYYHSLLLLVVIIIVTIIISCYYYYDYSYVLPFIV